MLLVLAGFAGARRLQDRLAEGLIQGLVNVFSTTITTTTTTAVFWGRKEKVKVKRMGCSPSLSEIILRGLCCWSWLSSRWGRGGTPSPGCSSGMLVWVDRLCLTSWGGPGGCGGFRRLPGGFPEQSGWGSVAGVAHRWFGSWGRRGRVHPWPG